MARPQSRCTRFSVYSKSLQSEQSRAPALSPLCALCVSVAKSLRPCPSVANPLCTRFSSCLCGTKQSARPPHRPRSSPNKNPPSPLCQSPRCTRFSSVYSVAKVSSVRTKQSARPLAAKISVPSVSLWQNPCAPAPLWPIPSVYSIFLGVLGGKSVFSPNKAERPPSRSTNLWPIPSVYTGVLGGKSVFSPNKAERPPWLAAKISVPSAPLWQNPCAPVPLWPIPSVYSISSVYSVAKVSSVRTKQSARPLAAKISVPSVSLWQNPCAPAPLWPIPSVYSIFLGVLGGKSVFSPNKAERPPPHRPRSSPTPLYQNPLRPCPSVANPLGGEPWLSLCSAKISVPSVSLWQKSSPNKAERPPSRCQNLCALCVSVAKSLRPCPSVANPLGVLDFPRCTRWQKCLQKSEQSRAPALSLPKSLCPLCLCGKILCAPAPRGQSPRCTRFSSVYSVAKVSSVRTKQSARPLAAKISVPIPSVSLWQNPCAPALCGKIPAAPLGQSPRCTRFSSVYSVAKVSSVRTKQSARPLAAKISVSLWQNPCAPAPLWPIPSVYSILGVLGGKSVFSPNNAERPALAKSCAAPLPQLPLWPIPSVYSIFLGVLGGKSVFSPNKAERPPSRSLCPLILPNPLGVLSRCTRWQKCLQSEQSRAPALSLPKSLCPLCLCGKIPAPLPLCGQSPRCTRFSSVYSVAKVSSVRTKQSARPLAALDPPLVSLWQNPCAPAPLWPIPSVYSIFLGVLGGKSVFSPNKAERPPSRSSSLPKSLPSVSLWHLLCLCLCGPPRCTRFSSVYSVCLQSEQKSARPPCQNLCPLPKICALCGQSPRCTRFSSVYSVAKVSSVRTKQSARPLAAKISVPSVSLWQNPCAPVANPLGVLDFPRCTRWQKCLQSEQSRAPALSLPKSLPSALWQNPCARLCGYPPPPPRTSILYRYLPDCIDTF